MIREADIIQVADLGGGRSVSLPVMGIQASWELNAAGSFSAFTTPDALAAAGLWGSLAGKWITWAHQTAGTWGGVAIGKPATHGVNEIAAEGFAVLMRGRAVDSTDRLDQLDATAGGIARRAFASILDGIPLFLTLGEHEESGDPAVTPINGRDLLSDVLGTVASDSDVTWYVDADRVLHIGRALGEDLTARVVLVEDREIVDFRLGDDLWTAQASEEEQYEPRAVQATAASILSTGKKTIVRKRHRKKQHRAGSKGRHRLGRAVHRARPHVMVNSPGPAAPSLLVDQDTLPRNVGITMLSVPVASYIQIDTLPLELTILDRNNAFATTALGNTVRVVIESARFSGQFRVHSRAIDTTQGTMVIAGECRSDEVG